MSSQTVFRFTSRNGAEGLQEFKEPIPAASKYEILIKVRSVALNYRDVAIMNCKYPLPVADNVIPCSDMAGEVAEVGDLVTNFSVGDRVIAPIDITLLYGTFKDPTNVFGGVRDGMLQEYIALPAHAIIKLPKSPHNLTQWASIVGTGSTVWNSFYGNNPLRAGQTVLILGTGGVSITALVFAKAAGATTIITSSSDEKLKSMKSQFGADHTINYKTHPKWSAEVQRITNGHGADHIIENGGEGTIEQSIQSSAYGGIISLIGFLTTLPADKLPNVTMQALVKASVLRGILGGSKQQLEEAVNYISSQNLPVYVDKTFGFNRDEIVAALKYIESGQHTGKVCINLE